MLTSRATPEVQAKLANFIYSPEGEDYVTDFSPGVTARADFTYADDDEDDEVNKADEE